MKYYTLFLLGVAITLLVWRLVTRRIRREEVVLAAVVTVHAALVSAQILWEVGFFPLWASRYVWPGDAMTLCLIAVMLAPFCERFGRRKWWIALVVLLALVARRDYKCCKEYFKWKVRLDAIRSSSEWAADLIRKDWKGGSSGPAWTYDRSEYYPDRQPVVFDYFGQTHQAVGGRLARTKWDIKDDQAVWPRETPDYICLMKGHFQKYVDWYVSNGGELVAERTFNGFPFIFCKRRSAEAK